MSDSVRPHRRQPTRLSRPQDSPGKNTGVGCHFLLQCMKVKSESEFAQSCQTLSDPMDCSLPGSSVHGIFQARGLEWGVIAFSVVYLRLLTFLLAILIPPCASSSPEFLMMYSARLHTSFIGYNRSPRVSCTGLSLIPRPSSGRTTLWNVSPVT